MQGCLGQALQRWPASLHRLECLLSLQVPDLVAFLLVILADGWAALGHHMSRLVAVATHPGLSWVYDKSFVLTNSKHREGACMMTILSSALSMTLTWSLLLQFPNRFFMLTVIPAPSTYQARKVRTSNTGTCGLYMYTVITHSSWMGRVAPTAVTAELQSPSAGGPGTWGLPPGTWSMCYSGSPCSSRYPWPQVFKFPAGPSWWRGSPYCCPSPTTWACFKSLDFLRRSKPQASRLCCLGWILSWKEVLDWSPDEHGSTFFLNLIGHMSPFGILQP